MNRDDFLPFALPSVSEDEINEVVDTLRSGWWTTGAKAKRFEADFAKFVGARHAIAVNSATAGLHLALEAIGIGPGDKVITTTFTFTATAEVIRYLGADPLFVDIDPQTLNISVDQVEDVLKNHPEVKAIMPVHFAGQACEMDELQALAEQYGVRLVEDAAHALPATYKGRRIGTLGDATVYSFYVTKTIATGEGGMVVTDDDAIAERVRVMRLHGISRDVFDRYTSDKPAWYYEVIAPGYKYNMTDIAASLGLHQLKRAEAFRQRRELMAQRYDAAFADLPVRLPFVKRPDDIHAWHLYVLRLQMGELTIDRDRFIELMAERGIGTSVHFIPLHRHPYWRDTYQLDAADFPVAEQVFAECVSLPLFPAMSDADQQRVIEAATAILQDACG
ncbi:MAG: UDP-4-amino-4,6-dideoxy-N-acetyl-beta-L-altrosamine transaminase [endosymbiont of Seepiophila jonesi]|uniref:UDP-4-amino-4, 6-dideoxy-N-acetyl-beta-L-altrosamine transaminase n=1 Tax=endosymbiont of Lamellibrachia luymesi TaxID=2200907 RepID=A0A370DWH3_9GAMM|nr:MAG: UDP-4-amino-4,6-dideoxy-N-acetyl-beta-L-altrosamine transaminase [endosymbiont of Lamellibrachia luymesi]RDH92722.1 MAG: UDP-4-amino-4,6-dideoxy-N-acetyl-beta-L-altrosamine transaminase [endosymbiont of Seepiophila jonesi]